MAGVSCNLEELLNLRFHAKAKNAAQLKKVSTASQGNYASSFRGRGMDFSETRVYQPGDDIRTINWRVTAKTGKPHTKIFQVERERPVFLVVDLTPTMFFGTKVSFKSAVACQVAALLGWSSLKSGDRVGGMIFNDNDIISLKPSSNAQSLVHLCKEMVAWMQLKPTQENYDYQKVFHMLRQIIRPGSLIYFISDFYKLDDNARDQLVFLAKNHDMKNILVCDPLECEPPKSNIYGFTDLNHQNKLDLDFFSLDIIRGYQQLFESRLQQLQKMEQQGVSLLTIATNEDIKKVLLDRNLRR